MSEVEINGFKRLIGYLRQVERSYEDTDSQNKKIEDFYRFVDQYSRRKNMPVEDYMPENFINWFETILDDF